MLISQAHIVFHDDLPDEDVERLQSLDGTSFVEITKGDFMNPEAIGDVWSEEDMRRGEYWDGDKILVDQEYIPHDLLKDLDFEFSGQTRDHDGALIYW